jgi:hypothetical protein
LGDSEGVLYAALDAETEALDTLVWTPPPTVAGVLALLELWPDMQRARIDQADAIIILSSTPWTTYIRTRDRQR